MTNRNAPGHPQSAPIDFQQWENLLEGDNEGQEAIAIQRACLDLMDALSLDVQSIELQDKVLLQQPEIVVHSLVINKVNGHGVSQRIKIDNDELDGEDWQLVEDFLVDLNTNLQQLGILKHPLIHRAFESDKFYSYYEFSRQTPHKKAGDILADQYEAWLAIRESQEIDDKTPSDVAPRAQRRI